MISLKGIKPGTKVRAKNGEILEFKQFRNVETDYQYILRHANGHNYFYTNDGRLCRKHTTALDITEILNEEENTMDNYQTEDIDYTGCDQIIRQALENNKRILCHVSDTPFDDNQSLCSAVVIWIIGYNSDSDYPYLDDERTCWWKYARPVVKKQTYIMPPERAVPILIENGWEFKSDGFMRKEGKDSINPQMLQYMGQKLEGAANRYNWPECILETK